MLGLVGRSTMHDLLTSILSKDVPAVLDVISRVYQYGQDLGQLYRSLMESLRNMMVLKAGYSNLALPKEEKSFLLEMIRDVAFEELHRILSVLIHSEEDFKYTSVPKITLETVLLRIVSAPDLTDIQQVIQALSGKQGAVQVRQTIQIPAAEKYKKPLSTLPHSWDGFVTFLKDHDQPLYAMLTSTNRISEKEDIILWLAQVLLSQSR